MLCTGSSEQKVGACRGDAGGPVIDIIANGDGTITKEGLKNSNLKILYLILKFNF